MEQSNGIKIARKFETAGSAVAPAYYNQNVSASKDHELKESAKGPEPVLMGVK